MAALPYMQFHIAEYLADTAHLSTEEHGAYLLLIFNYWQRGKALDNSNGKLSNVVRLSNERWTDVGRTLAEFFTIDGDLWKHGRIERDLEAVNAKCEQARNARSQRKSYGRSTGVGTDVQRSSNEESIKRREEKREENNIPPEAVAKGILLEANLSGRELLLVLTDVCRGELSKGADPSELRDSLVTAWRDYEAVRSKIHAPWGAGKFFGEGNWKDPALWKVKKEPEIVATAKPKQVESLVDRVRRQEMADMQ